MQDGPLLREVLPGRKPRGVIARFDDLPLGPTSEHASYTSGMAVTALRVANRPRDFVSVRGPDAATYLQAMVSNDVEALGPGESCEALFLTPKARVIAPMTVFRRSADDFLLLTEPGLGARLRHELVRMRFAAKCEIETEEHTSSVVFGETEGIPTADTACPRSRFWTPD